MKVFYWYSSWNSHYHRMRITVYLFHDCFFYIQHYYKYKRNSRDAKWYARAMTDCIFTILDEYDTGRIRRYRYMRDHCVHHTNLTARNFKILNDKMSSIDTFTKGFVAIGNNLYRRIVSDRKIERSILEINSKGKKVQFAEGPRLERRKQMKCPSPRKGKQPLKKKKPLYYI